MKIRLKMSFPMFHNHLDVKRGDVIEIDDVSGNHYCRTGVAEPYGKGVKVETPVEKAVAPEHETETATVEAPAEDKPKPLDEDDNDEKPRPRPTPARRR